MAKKKIWMSISVVLIALYSFFFFRFYLPGFERYFIRELEERIGRDDKEIPIKELTNFKWDEVCVTDSYGSFDMQNYSNFKKVNSQPDTMDDSQWYLMLVYNKNQSIYYISIPRRIMSIKDNINGCFKEEAYFNEENQVFTIKTK